MYHSMKNFLDLQATDLKLHVVVNGNQYESGLHTSLSFNADDLVLVDDIEVLPRYRHLANDSTLQISEPFYQWYHKVSKQGWLLTPQISSSNDGLEDMHRLAVDDSQ
jgi:hypothetical protein